MSIYVPPVSFILSDPSPPPDQKKNRDISNKFHFLCLFMKVLLLLLLLFFVVVAIFGCCCYDRGDNGGIFTLSSSLSPSSLPLLLFLSLFPSLSFLRQGLLAVFLIMIMLHLPRSLSQEGCQPQQP